MLTTLTILSLDQGKIYRPVPDQREDQCVRETRVQLGEAYAAGAVKRPLKPWDQATTLAHFLRRFFAPTGAGGVRQVPH